MDELEKILWDMNNATGVNSDDEALVAEARASILKHYIPRKEVLEAIKNATSNPVSKPEIGPRDVNGAYLLGVSNGKDAMGREIKQKLHLEER